MASPPTKIEELSQEALDKLPEYSLSLPTNPQPGFFWKRRVPAVGAPFKWYVGVAKGPTREAPTWVPIEWREVRVMST